jgi:hypothetical protein
VITNWHQRGGVTEITYWRIVFPVSWSLWRQIQARTELCTRAEIDWYIERHNDGNPNWKGLTWYRSHEDNRWGERDGRVRRRSQADTVVRGDYLTRVDLDHEEHWSIASLVYRIDIDPNREAIAYQLSNVQDWLKTIYLATPEPTRRTLGTTNPTPTPARSAKARRKAKNKRRTKNNLNPPLGSPTPSF